jgi:hypothetical protein
MGLVIQHEFGGTDEVSQVGRLVKALGCSLQKPGRKEHPTGRGRHHLENRDLAGDKKRRKTRTA